MISKDNSTYAQAGVDIDAADNAKKLIKQHTHSTFGPEVLTDIGMFGGMFEFRGGRQSVLVSSADGVGTKIKIASLLDKHDTVGVDLVNHCVNDILACGAAPLFFLDYIAMGKLIPQRVERIVSGLASACREAGCALIGGETAEMPGIYHENDYDLAGFIVGFVEKEAVLTGYTIKEGDILLGLPSSGLHTNGYSLVRRVFAIDKDITPLKKVYSDLGHTLGEELLVPHRCYFRQLEKVLPLIKGMAHITGGGIPGNLPRILPDGMGARIKKNVVAVPPIFNIIQDIGGVSEPEMYRVFNMGIGMILVCSAENLSVVKGSLPDAKVIGNVVKSSEQERIILE